MSSSEPSASPSPRQTVLSSPRRIVLWPAPVLLAKAKPVERIDAAIRELVEDMIRVMRMEEGAGLAAPQVGESLRLFVVEARKSEDGRPADPLGVYVNPRLVSIDGPVEPYEEGCLSLPDIRADIRRPPAATIEATDLEGRVFRRTDAGILARVWQHEFDHLEGTVILDRMSPKDRLATAKLVKELRAEFEASSATRGFGSSSSTAAAGLFGRGTIRRGGGGKS